MSDQTLLLIDPNAQNLSVMEIHLRKHGYEVVTAESYDRAIQLISISPPDLIISEYELGFGKNAKDLCTQLKSETASKSTPFMIITDHEAKRMDCLSAGADDVLVKPIYMAELKDRAELLLQRKRRVGLEQGGGQRFFGRLEEMGLLDLLQVIDVSKRSGKLTIEHKAATGALWFQEGVLHDAEMGHLKGKDALHRLFTWEFGQYEFDFKAPARPNVLNTALEVIRADGLKHIDQWNKMCEQLPPLETIFRHDPAVLADRAEPLDRLLKRLITRFDGQKNTLEIINASPEPDLDVLQGLTLLYFEGLIYEMREVINQSESPEPVFIDPQGNAPPVTRDDEFDESMSFPMDDDEILPPPVDLHGEAEQDIIPEEGQDLLAELYAAPSEVDAGDFNPPPLPSDLQEDEEQADDAYSTLFGIDGAFDYAEEEAAFFEEDKEEENPFSGALPPTEVSGSARAFWGLLIASIAIGVAFYMQDRVMPLELSQRFENVRGWQVFQLSERDEFYRTKPVSDEWEIEVSSSSMMLTQISNPSDTSSSEPSRPVSAKSKRKIDDLLKKALSLKSQGGDAKWKEASKLVEQALGLQPKNPLALLLLASLHMELGEPREALVRLKALWLINPNYGNTKIGGLWGPGVVYTALGNTLQELKNNQEAVKYYEDYLRAYPSGPQSAEIRRLVRELKNRGL